MREYTKVVQRQAFKMIEFYRQHPVVAAFDLLNVELAPIQAYILTNMWFCNYSIVVAGRGAGKALKIDTPIRVKGGWKPIGELEIGDEVYGGDGKLTKVIMTTPVQEDLNFYRITLRDDRTIECCEDHLWSVASILTDFKFNKVKSTKSLLEDYTNVKYYIPVVNGMIDNDNVSYNPNTAYITNIEPIGKADGCCIMVDNEDHTYITKDYIVTHNSFLQAVNAALTVLLYPGKRVGLIGSSFRQAKTIFNEVDRIYQMSPILQEAAERKPIQGTDMCLLRFKPAGRYTGTRIAAIPLGNDGGKIRGERFHVIAADEFAQIPESIFNLVIKPMAATASDPMERAKRIARAKELAKMGIEADDDDISNKIIMSSSGYYKTNHMWGRMKYYWSRMKAKDKRYSVIQVPYWFMPEGFLDETNIEEARETLPRSLFEMEYCGMMISDTDGFYKASLLEECTANTIDNFHTVTNTGKPDSEYIMAIDPARERDSFAILIFEVLGVKSRIVYAKTYDQVSSIKTAKAIFELRNKFNLARIIMDSQGGGSNIRDLLEEGIDNNRPILNIDDKNNFGRDGDMILEMFKPSPKANTSANYTSLSMLEHKRVWFPAPPQVADDKLEDIYDECVKLKRQIVSIVTAQLGGGYLKFMSSAPRGKKDLYSCFIMGCEKINELYKESFILEEAEPILEFGGIINNNLSGDGFDAYSERSRPLIVPGVKIYG